MWGGPPFGTGPQQFGGHFDVRGAVGADVGREKRRRGSEMDRCLEKPQTPLELLKPQMREAMASRICGFKSSDGV